MSYAKQKKAIDKYTKEVLLYFSFDFLKTWNEELEKSNNKKMGRRFQFPKSMIEFCSKTKFAFKIGWRQVKGILNSLKKGYQFQKFLQSLK